MPTQSPRHSTRCLARGGGSRNTFFDSMLHGVELAAGSSRIRMSSKRKSRERLSTGSIPRDPWPEVKQQLRQEVHYACPVTGCGRPFLMWHHFDPPWSERHHHNPAGMIALCTKCHPLADGGHWTKDELRSFKNNPPGMAIIRDTFGWSERHVVYRLGGNYAANCSAGVVAVGGQKILWNDLTPQGRLLVSVDFFGSEGKKLLEVRENSMSVDANKVWDLTLDTEARHLKLWLGERKPGIELKFDRLSPEGLKARMDKDDEVAAESLCRLLKGDALDTG